MANYKLFNQSVSFPDSAERFFDMQHRVWGALTSASTAFNEWYKNCGDILTVLKGYEKKSTELVIKYANKPLFDELPTHGIYDISEDSYDKECLDFSNSSDAYDAVADKYDEIIAEQAAEEEYRAERKANRGRVVGGGFGVGGALKGMATAGAMNAIAGAGHGIVNAIGNASSAIAAASSKKALYSNDATCKILREGIRSDILYCFNAHMSLLNNRLSSYIVNVFDSDKASALFENAKKVEDKQQELLFESFKNCPWDEELLKFIFINYKGERKNIWESSKRFHVDLSKTAEKAFADSYTEKAKSSEEEAQAVKKDILAQMQELGITTSDTFNKIERDGLRRVLQSYEKTSDEERATIFEAFDSYDATLENKKNVVHKCGIWELAQRYSVKFNKEEADVILSRYYTDSAKNSEANALKVRSKIREIMKTLGMSESNTLDTLENDCLERVCHNYQNADEEMCNRIIKRIKEFEALEKNKKPFLQKVQAQIESIWSKEDGEIFDNVYMGTNIYNPVEINQAIEFIKTKGRTSSSEKYISALSNCTAENIKKAKKFQSPLTKFFMYGGLALIALGIIFLFVGLGFIVSLLVAGVGIVMLVYYNSLKKIYNILTLNGMIRHKMLYVGDAKTK
jgi:hypothetical protein